VTPGATGAGDITTDGATGGGGGATTIGGGGGGTTIIGGPAIVVRATTPSKPVTHVILFLVVIVVVFMLFQGAWNVPGANKAFSGGRTAFQAAFGELVPFLNAICEKQARILQPPAAIPILPPFLHYT
jgi:hypothetical protein